METAVKERLVGAVVLVGLIVALVPEMLSGPRRQAGTDSAANGSVRTYTIDLTPATAARAPAVETQPAPIQDIIVEQPAAASARPEQSAEPQSANAGATTPSPSEAPARPVEVARPATEAQQDRQQATARTQAAPQSGWVVQLGSFASRDNAERLAAEVRKGGYRAFVSRFESGRSVRYRVRVGPEAQRAQAEAVAQRLQRDGRQVSIVPHP